ncbi:MAG: polymer-forming cytoskeletal protein, partial [Burkholderiales bacterium]|nr:polymer-forming cytoskeletal protein [Burkholderiales bacterium]
MFSKQAKTSKGSTPIEPLPLPSPGAGPEGARKAPPRAASLISPDITVEGGVTGEAELQIDGVVRGDVRVARLTIGETGHVEGSI